MTKKLLFISHDDSRTGAPILLLNLTKAIKMTSSEIQIDFLIKNCKNQILNDFQQLGQTFILNKEKKENLFSKILIKVSRQFYKKTECKIKGMNLNSYDLILSNTITNGDILPLIRKYYSGKIVSYIHELKMASEFFTSHDLIKNVVINSDLFAYPSETVKKFMINEFVVSTEHLFYLPYYILPKEKPIETVKNNQDLFVIGGCGTIDWRKGFDLFIQLACSINDNHKSAGIKFIWKGAIAGIDLDRAYYDIEKTGLKNSIQIQFSGSNMDDFWNSIDLFVLTSREDPFPLVVLEAARYKIPTVAFQGSGGASEFVSDDAGVLVPYLSISQMKDSIIDLYSNTNKREKYGVVAFSKMDNLFSKSEIVANYFMRLVNLK